jgi:hypothetical protein
VVGAELASPAAKHRSELATWVAVALATWGLALLGCALLALTVGVAPGGHWVAHSLLGASATITPHPASGRTVGYALGLLLNNAIVALWPLTGLFVLRDFPPAWRRVFIAVVVLSGVRSVARPTCALHP